MLSLLFWLTLLLRNAAASQLAALGVVCQVDGDCASGKCSCTAVQATTSGVSRTSPLGVLTLGAGALCLWRESGTGVLTALLAAERFGLAWGSTQKCSCAPSVAFENWKSTFGKQYADQQAEFAAFERWQAMDQYINDTNSNASSSFQMAHNHLSDLHHIPKGHTASKLYPLPTPINGTVTNVSSRLLAEERRLPASVDWAAQGKVTAVKEQGQCDSCWTFASTGAMESAYAIEQNTDPFDLSPQQLVACNTGTSNFVNGQPTCSVGGNIADAFLYAGAATSSTITVGMWNKDYFTMTIADVGWTDQMPKTTPILQYSTYPYTGGCVNGCSSGSLGCGTSPQCQPPLAGTQTCLLGSKSGGASLSISSFVWVETETDLMAAVAQQPVAVSIYVSQAVQGYSSGVLDTSDCTGMTDHAVLVVGYGTDGGVDYWKIKNSWSTLYGENGYFRMVRGKNMCGLGDQSKNSVMAYPTGATRSGSYTAPTPAPTPPPTPALPASQQPWANPSTGACGVGTDISQPISVTTSGGTASLTFGAPAGTPCSPSCTNGATCPPFPGMGKNPYPYCYYTSAYGSYCALLCGVNGWNCPTGMSCSSSSGQGTCKY